MNDSAAIGRVPITGANGNLGQKLIAHLLASSWCEAIIGVDRAVAESPAAGDRVEPVAADLTDARDARWRDAMRGVDAVVHFAAQNPYPDAGWNDACASFDMTQHVVEAAAAAGVRRLVFASSNHVMGQYKDPPLADLLTPGGLTTSLEPGPGTRWFDGRQIVQGTAYAVSKLMGERLCVGKAALSGGAFTTVSLRIGWCQPGDNRPETISATGIPADAGQATAHPSAERDLAWFRNMWLSNRDFAALLECALVAEASGWPSPGIIVNGMSGNAGMPWEIGTARALIGYVPQDDVWARLGAARIRG
jgi:nucleoside-diphosphate-sugar epimerase